MKIRAGFVSNSSSCSFCMLGRYMGTITDDSHEVPDFTKPDTQYLMIGADFGEGYQDLVELTEEKYLWFRKNIDKVLENTVSFEGSIYEAYATSYDTYSETVDLSLIPCKSVEMINMTIEQGDWSYTMEDVKRNYGGEDGETNG